MVADVPIGEQDNAFATGPAGDRAAFPPA